MGSFSVIYGDSSFLIDNFFLTEILSCQALGSRVFFLSQSNDSEFYLREKSLGFRPEFFDFTRIFDDMMSFFNLQRFDSLDIQTLKFFISKSVFLVRNSLRVFHRAYKNFDFVNFVLSFIKFLEDNLIDIDSLLSRTSDRFLGDKLLDLKLLLDTLDYHLAKEGFFRKCRKIEFLKKLDLKEYFKDSLVFINNFSLLDPFECEMIKFFIPICPIYFGVPNFKKKVLNRQVELFETFCSLNKFRFNSFFVEDTNLQSREILYFCNNIFDFNVKIRRNFSDDVKVTKASNKFSEAVEVANIINSLLNEKHELSDLCIVLSNFDSYAFLPKVLGSYNINFFLDSESFVSKRCVFSFIKTIFDLVLSDFRKADLIAFFSYDLIGIDESELSRVRLFLESDNDILESYILDIPSLESHLSCLYEFASNKNQNKTVADFVAELYLLFESLGFIKFVNSKIDGFLEIGCEKDARQPKEDFDLIFGIMSEIKDVYADVKIGLFHFWNILSSSVECLRDTCDKDLIDGVLITDAYHFSSSKKVVIFLGFDQNFPLVHEEEFTLFDFNSLGFEPQLFFLDQANSCEFFIADLFSNAGNKIFIVYSSEPSFVLDEVVRFFPNSSTIVTAPKVQTSNVSRDISNKPFLEQNFYIANDILKKIYSGSFCSTVSKVEKFNMCGVAYFLEYIVGIKNDFFSSCNIGSLVHKVVSVYFKNAKREDGIFHSNSEELLSLIANVFDSIFGDDIKKFRRFEIMRERVINLSFSTIWSSLNFYRDTSFLPLFFEMNLSSEVFENCVREVNGIRILFKGFIDCVDVFKVRETKYVSIIDYKSSVKKMDPVLFSKGIQLQLPIYMNECLKFLNNASIFKPGIMAYFPIAFSFAECIDDSCELPFVSLEKDILKKTKMRGYVLENEDILNSFDKSGGEGYSKRTRLSLEKLSFCDISSILNQASSIFDSSVERILKGEIFFNKFKASNFNPCKFCPYAKLCEQIKF